MNQQYGLDPKQFLIHVIRPTHRRLALGSLSADVLVLGTGLTESGLRYLDQIDRANRPGPAFGVDQMEGATHLDIWRNHLAYNFNLRVAVTRFATYYSSDFPDPGEMAFNLAYATAMCRVDYHRAKPALPAPDDAMAMALYHKKFYNSADGKTNVEESVKHFEFASHLCLNTGDRP